MSREILDVCVQVAQWMCFSKEEFPAWDDARLEPRLHKVPIDCSTISSLDVFQIGSCMGGHCFGENVNIADELIPNHLSCDVSFALRDELEQEAACESDGAERSNIG